MNQTTTNTSSNGPKLSDGQINRISRWGKLLAKFLSIQLVVQVLGAATGILLIRKLSQQDYAWFTLATTMQGTLTNFADVGIGNALYATGGKYFQQYSRLGQVIATGLKTRKMLSLVSGVVVTPIFVMLLLRDHASWINTILITIAVLLGWWWRLTNDIYTVVPNLRSQIDRLQKLDLIIGFAKLAALVVSCLLFVNTAIAIMISSITFAVQNPILKKWTHEGADTNEKINKEDEKEILTFVRQQAPSTVYYCIQGQLTVFLISMYGSTKTLAELGALGRIAVIFNMISMVLSRVVLPKIATCQDKGRLLKMFIMVSGLLLLIGLTLIGLSYFLPGPFIWVLGSKYSFATKDLVWVVLGSVIWMFVSNVGVMFQMKGWLKFVWTAIPLMIIAQFALARFCDLSSIKGVTLVTVVPRFILFAAYLYSAFYGFKRFKPQEQNTTAPDVQHAV